MRVRASNLLPRFKALIRRGMAADAPTWRGLLLLFAGPRKQRSAALQNRRGRNAADGMQPTVSDGAVARRRRCRSASCGRRRGVVHVWAARGLPRKLLRVLIVLLLLIWKAIARRGADSVAATVRWRAVNVGGVVMKRRPIATSHRLPRPPRAVPYAILKIVEVERRRGRWDISQRRSADGNGRNGIVSRICSGVSGSGQWRLLCGRSSDKHMTRGGVASGVQVVDWARSPIKHSQSIKGGVSKTQWGVGRCSRRGRHHVEPHDWVEDRPSLPSLCRVGLQVNDAARLEAKSHRRRPRLINRRRVAPPPRHRLRSHADVEGRTKRLISGRKAAASVVVVLIIGIALMKAVVTHLVRVRRRAAMEVEARHVGAARRGKEAKGVRGVRVGLRRGRPRAVQRPCAVARGGAAALCPRRRQTVRRAIAAAMDTVALLVRIIVPLRRAAAAPLPNASVHSESALVGIHIPIGRERGGPRQPQSPSKKCPSGGRHLVAAAITSIAIGGIIGVVCDAGVWGLQRLHWHRRQATSRAGLGSAVGTAAGATEGGKRRPPRHRRRRSCRAALGVGSVR